MLSSIASDANDREGLAMKRIVLPDTKSPALLDLAVIVPTYNERENIPLLLARLDEALRGLNWEAVFVDDDSPDGTGEIVSAHASAQTELASRIRLLQRVGRRGLSLCLYRRDAGDRGAVRCSDGWRSAA